MTRQQVFSCEYQLTALAYLGRGNQRSTVGGGIPFYPPPPGAEGSCCQSKSQALNDSQRTDLISQPAISDTWKEI